MAWRKRKARRLPDFILRWYRKADVEWSQMLSRALALLLVLAMTATAAYRAQCIVRCVTPAAPLCHHQKPAKQSPCDARSQVVPIVIAIAESPLEYTALFAPVLSVAGTAERAAPASPHPDPPPILRI